MSMLLQCGCVCAKSLDVTLTANHCLPVTGLSGFPGAGKMNRAALTAEFDAGLMSSDEMRGSKEVWITLEDPFPEFGGGEADAAPQAQGVR